MGRSDTSDSSAKKDTSDAYTDASSCTDETPQHDVTVSSFALDKYEVTVGRFRQFMANYEAWRNAGNPKAGDGQNPNNPVIPNPTGWVQSWTPPVKADFIASLKPYSNCNWTDATGTNEQYPINCVSWFEAFAYCIWDEGGRLPTEAEWEFAAAGGDQNRLYPWAGTTIDATRANYAGTSGTPKKAVGSYLAGAGRFGHMDLAGSMWEWAFDWYLSGYYTQVGNLCNNCTNAIESSYRVFRGGSWGGYAFTLRAASRSGFAPVSRHDNSGFRCARPTQ